MKEHKIFWRPRFTRTPSSWCLFQPFCWSFSISRGWLRVVFWAFRKEDMLFTFDGKLLSLAPRSCRRPAPFKILLTNPILTPTEKDSPFFSPFSPPPSLSPPSVLYDFYRSAFNNHSESLPTPEYIIRSEKYCLSVKALIPTPPKLIALASPSGPFPMKKLSLKGPRKSEGPGQLFSEPPSVLAQWYVNFFLWLGIVTRPCSQL